MRNARSAFTLVATAVGVVALGWGLQAQDDRKATPKTKSVTPPEATSGSITIATKPPINPAETLKEAPAHLSVQEALQRPFFLPFGEPTTLTEVCRHLRMILKAPVVLDLAALKRLDLTGEDTVQLELHGVRLKTGLKLLLDQVDLTYRVEPEDNLLVITDTAGSEDPLDRVFTELKVMRRHMLDLQDSVDEIRSALGIDTEEGPKMRKPTIIEELPEDGAKKPATPPANSSPRTRPGL